MNCTRIISIRYRVPIAGNCIVSVPGWQICCLQDGISGTLDAWNIWAGQSKRRDFFYNLNMEDQTAPETNRHPTPDAKVKVEEEDDDQIAAALYKYPITEIKELCKPAKLELHPRERGQGDEEEEEEIAWREEQAARYNDCLNSSAAWLKAQYLF